MSKEILSKEDAIYKLKDLAESIDFNMMATNLGNKPFHAIPMSTKKVDEEGNIWFLSGADSEHNENIMRDSNLMLIYSKPGDMTFLKVYGNASITKDKRILEELYSKSDDLWFEGLEDPNLTAIKVNPIEAYYWEPKNNKFVSFLKMGIATLTGNEPQITSSGGLNV